MGKSFQVSTIFKGVDLVSPIFKTMGRNSDKFGNKASRNFAKASKGASRFGDIVKGVLTAGLIQRGISELTQGLRAVTEEFIDFDQALTSAGAKFPQTIRRGTEGFKELGAIARKVGSETEFSAADAGRGLDFLAMAGFNLKQAAAALPKTVDLATIANMDLATATDIASDSLGAFNLMTKDSVQLQANLGRVNDVMATTITRTNTNLEQLFDTYKMAGPVATAAGQSIETFSAIAGTMAQAGIKTTQSGTAMRTMFANLAGKTPKAARALKKMGVAIKDSNGNFRDMFDILDDVRKGTAKMGNVQKLATLTNIFGKRAIAAVNVVLNESTDNLREFRRELENSNGASMEMAGNVRKSLGNQLKVLKSSLIELGFKFLEAFVGRGEKSLEVLIEAVRTFDVKPVVDAVNGFIDVMKTLIETVQFFWPIIKGVGATLLAVKTVIMAVQAAQWLWNIAMMANPIGLIIVGIAALVGIIIFLKQNWQSVTAYMKMTVIALRNHFMDQFDDLKEMFLSFINTIIGGVNKVFALVGSKKKFDLLEMPDNKAKIARDMDLIRARNDLLVARVKEDKGFREDFMKARQSEKGLATAKSFREASFAAPKMSSPLENIMAGPRSVDPSMMRLSQQNIGFEGQLNIAGAPKGSTFESKTVGAPPIRTEMLGVNP